ncbi:MAG TPA: HesA/MoeB/ThiF family protein [Methanobacterium sp.]|nr:HesA/MoeB/ThiF family protein [Methanobacterium sp.]
MAEEDNSYYWDMITRQKELINKKEQLKLKNSKIAVIGCGGIGGAAMEMLARMGAEKLLIVDKDCFDLSNLNRQLMSNSKNIGKSKVFTSKERLLSINPQIDVEAIDGELNAHNVDDLLKDCDVVVDALDNLISRIIICRVVYDLEIPFIHGAVHGTMGQITTFTSKTPQYEELFKLPSCNQDLTDEVVSLIDKLNLNPPPVIGPVPNIVGCLQSFEALKILMGNSNLIKSPDVLMFDLLKKEPFYTVNYQI